MLGFDDVATALSAEPEGSPFNVTPADY